MKNILYLLLPFVISCNSNPSNEVKAITDKNIIELLIFSELTDLNELQADMDKGLWLKLYKVPNTEANKCFPESHGICNYKYYLATSQLDDSPIASAYYLGILGEIIEYKWQETDVIDTAKIIIKANKYSKYALNYNKKLKNEVTVFDITATPNSVSIVELKHYND